MACKKSCRKFFLRGENACERCKDRESCTETEEEVDEGEDLEDEDEPEDEDLEDDDLEDEDESDEDESDEDDGYEDTYTDAFGNENMKHIFTVPVEKFVWKGRKYSGNILIAADSAEEAVNWLESQDTEDLFDGIDDLECLDGADLVDAGPVEEDVKHLVHKGAVSDAKETDNEEFRD